MVTSKEVIIIGGGVSGLGMVFQLQRLLGHQNFTIYEKSDNIGGTWWHNRYPGCACDIPSHLYSYSFALKLDWSSTYPGRDELHSCGSCHILSLRQYPIACGLIGRMINYLHLMSQISSLLCEKYDILRRCRFNTTCKSLVWDSSRKHWICTFQDDITGQTFVRTAAVVVSAVETLDRPYIPEIEGTAGFQGKAFYSARWDHSVNFRNKNVVVLGNGASVTQLVPEIVKEVAPRGKGNPVYSSAWKFTSAYVPLVARMYRFILAWQLEKVFYSFLMTDSGQSMRDETRESTMRYIENNAPMRYREVLKPNYEPGCKRRVNTATYFACLHSPNMDLSRERVVRIGPKHVETDEGNTYQADVIVYATGFMAQKWLYPIEVKGVGGKDIHEIWDVAGGAEAYKGTVVSGFPNFFILYGPNTATGQHSVIFHSECQINYSCRLVRPVLSGSNAADSIMVKSEAQARDLRWVHSKLKNLVFNSGCQSWWMVPKTKKNTFIYRDLMYKYWLRTIFPTRSHFAVEENGVPQSQSSGMICLATLASLGVAAWTWSSFLDVDKVTASMEWLQKSVWVK